MTPITEQLPDGEQPKRIAVTIYPNGTALNGPDRPEIGNVEDLLRYFATVHDRFGNTIVTIGDLQWGGSACHVHDKWKTENARLVPELETAEKWRLALESFTAQGSEFVNDLDRCVEYVSKRISEGHEAKKDVVRLRRELETAKRALEHYEKDCSVTLACVKCGHEQISCPSFYDWCHCGDIAQAALKSE